MAEAIWHESDPASETLVEAYLKRRGIFLEPSPCIRYHPSLWHGPTGQELSAMVAAVHGPDGKLTGIHRTYLDHRGRKAEVSEPKMALGPISGGAVRLGPAEQTLGVAEGIETALSGMQLFGGGVWAGLGRNMKNVILPDIVERVVIYGDNGDAGHRLAEQTADVVWRQGRKVKLVYPTQPFDDFNDVLGHERGKP